MTTVKTLAMSNYLLIIILFYLVPCMFGPKIYNMAGTKPVTAADWVVRRTATTILKESRRW